jgi:hypothetical protein
LIGRTSLAKESKERSERAKAEKQEERERVMNEQMNE